MIEPRVYRAAFVPALLALFLTMFSLQSRPPPLEQGLAADILFDGRLAAIESARIAEREPDRRAGGGPRPLPGHQMQDPPAIALGMHRAADRQLPARPAQPAGVARLPAGARIEHGAVELDPIRAGGGHRRLRLGEIGVVAEEKLGHGTASDIVAALA
jgi:hypothetical protein